MKHLKKTYYALLCALSCLLAATGAVAGSNEWTREGAGLNATVNVLQFHAGRTDTLFAGAVDGFYRSGDGGQTWLPSGALLVDRSVLSLAVDPERPTQLYAGTHVGLFTSSDGGRQWRSVSSVTSGVLSLSPGQGGRVYAGTFGEGIYLSENRGETWRAAGGELASEIVFALAAHPFESNTIYAGTGRGLYVSRNGGASWQAVADLAGQSVRSIVVGDERTLSGLIVVGAFGGGVFISQDSGDSWRVANSGLSDRNVRMVAIDLDVPGLYYAATAAAGFFRTRDGGGSWTAINEGLGDLATRWIGVVPGVEGRLLGLTRNSGIYALQFEPEARARFSASQLNFGPVAVGSIASLAVDISNDGQASLVVSNINVDRESAFGVSPASLTVKAGQTERVQVRFQPQQRGAVSTNMMVRSNDPFAGSTSISLLGTGVQAQLKAQPSAVRFGAVRVGGYVDTTVAISNEGNAVLELRNAFFEDSAFRLLNALPDALAPGQKALLRVRFVPLVARGISSNLVIVAGDGMDNKVPFDGIGTAPDIGLSSMDVDFGTVDIATARVQTLDISNSGNAPLTIRALSLQGESFSIDGNEPKVIAPGEIYALSLRFFPIEAGERRGVLTVESDAPGRQSSVQVHLVGAGGALALRAQEPLAAGIGSADLLVVDLNADGAADMVLADSAGGKIHVHINDGAGAFTAMASYPSDMASYGAWDRPAAMAVAPIFGSAPDLVVADPVARSLSLLANDGQGGFDQQRTDVYIGHVLADVLAVDLDADGDVDIATANADDASVTILYNNGRGNFNARAAIDVGSGPAALAAGHLNADDHRDLVVANSAAGTISVVLADLQGGFLTHQDYVVGQGPISVHVVDFDADGDNDVLAGSRGSRDVAVLLNDGSGRLTLLQRINVDIPLVDMALSDLTRDIFSDLVVAGGSGDYIAFLENDGGTGLVVRDIITSQVPVRRVAIADLNGDGANDIAALSSSDSQVQVFLNEDARLGDPPRPPSGVEARDLGRDLGRQVEVVWRAPELDEQLGRTTRYTVFRSATRGGDYAAIDTLLAGSRRFIDPAATLADTFYYYIVAGNAGVESVPSDTVWAVSQPSPFFQLEVVDEARFSIGDTLVVRAFIVPTAHVLTGVSIYMSYDAEGLDLVDERTGEALAEGGELTDVQPFRVASAFEGRVIENAMHGGEAGRVNLSLVQSMGLPLIDAGVDPVLLGEVRFVTNGDVTAQIRIDEEPQLNRISAVVDDEGQWIPPFIPEQPIEIVARDYTVRGQVALQAREVDNANVQVSLHFYNAEGQLLVSPINDENRFKEGIQYTLDERGAFALAQIPPGVYNLLVKADTHLRGHVVDGPITIGGELVEDPLQFEWATEEISVPLPAGDANDDNRINLADFGQLVDYFNSNTTVEPAARRADFNGDGQVGLDDFMLLAENFGRIGMELAEDAVAKEAPSSAPVLLDANGMLRLQNPEDITALTLLFLDVDAASLSLRGTAWEERRYHMHTWDEGGATRLVIALAESRTALRSAEDLMLIPAGATPIGGQILRADGSLIDLTMEAAAVRPQHSALWPNYPNPFNPETTIPFAIGIGDGRRVELSIYNALGQNIRTIFDGALAPGMYRMIWDGRDAGGWAVSSGAYFYRLQTGDKMQVRGLLLLR